MEAGSRDTSRPDRPPVVSSGFEQSPQHERLITSIERSGTQYDLGSVSDKLSRLQHQESVTAFKSDLDRINQDFQKKGLLKHEGKDFELYESAKGFFDIRRAQKPDQKALTGEPLKTGGQDAKPLVDPATGEIGKPGKKVPPEVPAARRKAPPEAEPATDGAPERKTRSRDHGDTSERQQKRKSGGRHGGGRGRRRGHGGRKHSGRSRHARGAETSEKEKPLEDPDAPETDTPNLDGKVPVEGAARDGAAVVGDGTPKLGAAAPDAGKPKLESGPLAADRGLATTEKGAAPADKALPKELQATYDTIGRSPEKHTKDETALAIAAAVTKRAREEGLSDKSAKRLAQAFVAAGITETMDTKNALDPNDKSLDNTNRGDYRRGHATSFGPFQLHAGGQLSEDIKGKSFVKDPMSPQEAMAPNSALERSFNHFKYRFEKQGHKLTDLDTMDKPGEANEAIFKALKRSQAAGDRRYESKYRDYFPQAGQLLDRNQYYASLDQQARDKALIAGAGR